MTVVSISPQANTQEAIQFLKSFDTTGWHNLVAIHPDSRDVEGKTFRPGSWTEMERWIESWQGKRNIYFSANEPIPGSPDTKLNKKNIGRIRAVYIDVDPPRNVDFAAGRQFAAAVATQLNDHFLMAPTFTIDSGGGYQFFWMLPQPLVATNEAVSWAEAQSNGIGKANHGDHTFNIDRIMRLPGTINLPDAKKRATGRTPTAAKVVSANFGERFAKDTLAAWVSPLPPEERQEKVTGFTAEEVEAIEFCTDWKCLPHTLKMRLANALQTVDGLNGIWLGNEDALPGQDKTGSEFLFHLARKLRRTGDFTKLEFAQIAYGWEHGNLANKPDPFRQIARAWDRCGEMSASEEFAEVGDIGITISEQNQGVEVAGPKKGLFLVDGGALADEATNDDQPMLIDDLLTQGGMTVLYGDSNSGKTFVALDMAYAIASGKDWNGKKTTKGLVVYIAAEGGRGIKARVAALKKKYGWENTAFAIIPCPINLTSTQKDAAELLSLVATAEAQYAQPAALIVVDTVSRALAGADENSSTDMGAFVANVDRIRARTKAHLLCVHHSGKDKAKGARGHSLLRAATDTEIEIADKCVTVTKQRDLDYGEPMNFKLEVINLGVAKSGKELTSCVIKWVSEEEINLELTSAEQNYLEALEIILEDKSELNLPAFAALTEWDDKFFELFVKPLKKLDKGRSVQSNKKGYSRATLRRHRSALLEKGRVGVNEQNQWFIP